ncbi:hypothetical protein CJU89_6046 [Yarrowia sp. B02]|nr:hypothetical protein CJU89_6046 [Yarrowia sp. B02]
MIPTPVYTTEAHPIGVWQAWYSDNLAAIEDSSKYVFFGPSGHKDGSNDLQQIAVPFYPEWAGPEGGSLVASGPRSNGPANDIPTVAIPTQTRSVRDTCPASSSSANMRVYAPYEYTDSLNKRVCWTPYFLGSERQEFDSHLRMFMNYCRWANMRLRPAPQAERGDVKTEVVVSVSPGAKRPRSNGVLGGISGAIDSRPPEQRTYDRPSAKRPSYGASYATAGASVPSYSYAAEPTAATPYSFQLPPPKSTASLSPSIPSVSSGSSHNASVSSGSSHNASLSSGSSHNPSVSSVSSRSPVTSPYSRPLVSEPAAQQPGNFYSTYQNYYNLSQTEFPPFDEAN